jgi:hypothetical protein
MHEPTKTKVSLVTTVRFEFEDGDWCNCSLDEGSGQVSLSSMDFHYGYSWRVGSNLGGDPPYTLVKGVNGFCIDYLANKLGSGHGESYDPELTEAAVREIVEEARGRLPKGDDMDTAALCIEADLQTTDFSSYEGFLHTAPKWLEEPWNLTKSSPTRKRRLLTERYLPALKAWTREQVETAKVLRENKDEIIAALKADDPLDEMLDETLGPKRR